VQKLDGKRSELSARLLYPYGYERKIGPSKHVPALEIPSKTQLANHTGCAVDCPVMEGNQWN
jgi:hypothetical protein